MSVALRQWIWWWLWGYTMRDSLRRDGPHLIWSRNPPLEAKGALMRWRMATAPVKMTELMITMKVAIILIKWDEIWQEEMIFRAVLRCAISQMHHLAVSSPPTSVLLPIFIRGQAIRIQIRSRALCPSHFKTTLCIAPPFLSQYFHERGLVSRNKRADLLGECLFA